MTKKPRAPEPEPKKRPARKSAAKPTPAPKVPARKAAKPKAAPKPSPAKKPVAKKAASAGDPSAIAKKLMDKASASAGKAVRKNPLPVAEPELPSDDDAPSADTSPLMGCTPRMARFVDLYLALNFNGTQAYIEAGYTAKTDQVAAVNASRMLRLDKVRQLLAVRTKAMTDRTEAEQDRLMATLTAAAYVDPNELVSYRRGACRYCYGAKHRYQFTAGEWDQKLEAHEAKREKALAADRPDPGPLDAKGGTGYDKRLDPHPNCSECFGEGVGWQYIKDTTKLSPAAQALFAGVKDGKEGLQVLMHSQEKARDTLAKVHRMYEEGGNLNLTFNGEELSRTFGEKMAKSRARGEAMRRERFGDGGEGKATG